MSSKFKLAPNTPSHSQPEPQSISSFSALLFLDQHNQLDLPTLHDSQPPELIQKPLAPVAVGII
jgi:hypothetical protein